MSSEPVPTLWLKNGVYERAKVSCFWDRKTNGVAFVGKEWELEDFHHI